jgi:hypothetical protein
LISKDEHQLRTATRRFDPPDEMTLPIAIVTVAASGEILAKQQVEGGQVGVLEWPPLNLPASAPGR